MVLCVYHLCFVPSEPTITRTIRLYTNDTNKDADGWFLMLECFDPHEPFTAPERFREAYKTNYAGGILDWPVYGEVTESADEIAEIRADAEEPVLFVLPKWAVRPLGLSKTKVGAVATYPPVYTIPPWSLN